MKKSSSKTLKRIAEYSVMAIVLWMALCVLHKLIINNENWLWLSASWSIVYVLTLPIKPIVVKKEGDWLDKALWIIGVTLIVFLIVAFIVGVALRLKNWVGYTLDIVAPFVVALILGRPLKNKEEVCGEETEERSDEEYKKKTDIIIR